MRTRVGHVDIAKGISIILVAISHSKLMIFYPGMINSMGLFRMPLFFFLAGVFFNRSSNTYEFFWKKSDALLKPYFATLLFAFVINVLFKQEINILFKQEDLTWQLKGIFYGNGDTIRWVGSWWMPMWFLTHLFSVYAFTYFMFRLTNIEERNIYYKYVFIAILMTIGVQWIGVFWNFKIILLGKEIEMPGLPFSFDIILISSSFFIVGSFLRKKIVSFTPNFYILSISVLVFSVVAIFTDAHMNLNERIYINPLLTTIGAISGIYFVLYISFYLNRVIILRNVFLTFGQASLFILIFHLFFGSLAYHVFSWLNGGRVELWLVITAFLISILTPLVIKIIVLKNRLLSLMYLPVKTRNTINQG